MLVSFSSLLTWPLCTALCANVYFVEMRMPLPLIISTCLRPLLIKHFYIIEKRKGKLKEVKYLRKHIRKMALSEKACLRVRLALYTAFLISYVVGAVVFVVKFKNYVAAAGFILSSFFIAVAAALHIVTREGLYVSMPPEGRKRMIVVAFLASADVMLFGLALCTLVHGIINKESWTGESNYCSLTALLCAAKWCSVCLFLIYKSATPPPEHDSENLNKPDEKENVV
uniref:Uncharacterized protein TCIL3000_8_5780 n=1 Tax=Trypanosoma congolense (strain IL3000) TaxID=1068625 RepID=G0USJ1_TRYCI|nr:unnamed protein product [Trypanosoma congolense IL3000]